MEPATANEKSTGSSGPRILRGRSRSHEAVKESLTKSLTVLDIERHCRVVIFIEQVFIFRDCQLKRQLDFIVVNLALNIEVRDKKSGFIEKLNSIERSPTSLQKIRLNLLRH
jgi:hypothetical protein